MAGTRTTERTHERLRPISSAEIAGLLDGLAETVAARTGAGREGAPSFLAPSDLLRCLRRLSCLN